MRIIFSRKGFDSAAGKAASPIVEGRPISMPIPASKNSTTSYASIGLGEHVSRITKGRMTGTDLCHQDPMFVDDECIFGQTGIAQAHLARNKVTVGDLFLFFGLFSDEHTGERHHRFFGYLRVGAATYVSDLDEHQRGELQHLKHPHVMGTWSSNDMIYRGKGAAAKTAGPELRLTQPGGPVSQWLIPEWLQSNGMTYHAKPSRWAQPGRLAVVARGQELVCDVGDDPVPQEWAERIIAMIEA